MIPRFLLAAPTRLLAAPGAFSRLLQAPPGPPAYHGPAISHWPPPAALVARARVLPTSTSESRSQKHRTTSDHLASSISGRPALTLQLCLASSIISPRPLLNVARPIQLSRRCATRHFSSVSSLPWQPLTVTPLISSAFSSQHETAYPPQTRLFAPSLHHRWASPRRSPTATTFCLDR
ncbi:uncharacterized protein TrAtP1_007432 [Trichoderma atroviride]|uniref:uncharacterized protein n=1 Tax=Hypocrea atroviridis TaxID=63577 RepID=UPI0033221B50|nr:hypothetical protein TrAtP1_007432 [Trichoderma atroviride]